MKYGYNSALVIDSCVCSLASALVCKKFYTKRGMNATIVPNGSPLFACSVGIHVRLLTRVSLLIIAVYTRLSIERHQNYKEFLKNFLEIFILSPTHAVAHAHILPHCLRPPPSIGVNGLRQMY